MGVPPLGSAAECTLIEGLRATLKAVLAVRVTSCRLVRPQRACAVRLPPPCQPCQSCLVSAGSRLGHVWFQPGPGPLFGSTLPPTQTPGTMGTQSPAESRLLRLGGGRRHGVPVPASGDGRRVHDVRTPTAVLHDTFIRPILALRPGLRSVDRVSIAIARPTGPCRGVHGSPRVGRLAHQAPGPVNVSASRVRRASLDRHDRCSSSFYPAARARWAGPFAGPSPRYGAGTARRSTAVERRH